jgi:hypothetical protein
MRGPRNRERTWRTAARRGRNPARRAEQRSARWTCRRGGIHSDLIGTPPWGAAPLPTHAGAGLALPMWFVRGVERGQGLPSPWHPIGCPPEAHRHRIINSSSHQKRPITDMGKCRGHCEGATVAQALLAVSHAQAGVPVPHATNRQTPLRRGCAHRPGMQSTPGRATPVCQLADWRIFVAPVGVVIIRRGASRSALMCNSPAIAGGGGRFANRPNNPAR